MRKKKILLSEIIEPKGKVIVLNVTKTPLLYLKLMSSKFFMQTIILVLIILSFLFIVNLFQSRVENLKIERNSLYTDDVLIVNATFDYLIEAMQNSSKTYRLFGLLSESREDVRAYYTNDYSLWSPPLHSGRFFSEADTNEAIVGKNIASLQDYIYFGEKYYIVIGILGASGANYLNDTIILNEISAFSEGTMPYLLLDGDSDFAEIINQYFDWAYYFEGKNAVLLEFDFFTPMITGFGRGLAVIGSAFIALLLLYNTEALVNIKYQIGKAVLYQCLHYTLILLSTYIGLSLVLILMAYLFSIPINILRYCRDAIVATVIAGIIFGSGILIKGSKIVIRSVRFRSCENELH